MLVHHGSILEKTVRKSGCSITEIAKAVNTDRRTLYNWFLKPHLNQGILLRLGVALRHDFSVELPTLFVKDEFKNAINKSLLFNNNNDDQDELSDLSNQKWQEKYITLLERYNEMIEKSLKTGNGKGSV